MYKPLAMFAVGTFLSCFLAASVFAGAPGGGGGPPEGIQPPPPTVTVAVDCAAGDSINNALSEPAVELTIEITGICVEDVAVLRSHVTLRGAQGDATLDGIQEDPNTGPQRNPVDIFGTNFIVIEDLNLSGGFAGLGINASYGVNIYNSIIENNDFYGVLAGSGSGSIGVTDTVITADTTSPRGGIWVTNGSNLRCFGCTIENHREGVVVSQGSEFQFFSGTSPANIQGNRFGAQIWSNSRLYGDSGTLAGQAGGGYRGAILGIGSVSIELVGVGLNGKINLGQNSSMLINGVTHDDLGGGVYLQESSSMVALGNGNAMTANFTLSDFSNFTLHNGSTVDGALSCNRGGAAYCDTPTDVSDGSTGCGQCD